MNNKIILENEFLHLLFKNSNSKYNINSIVTLDLMNKKGITFAQLYKILNKLNFKNIIKKQCNGKNTKDLIDRFRNDIKNNLKNKNNRIICNYQMNQIGFNLIYGHFSPIGAYNVKNDRVLLLDVWAPKINKCWVKVETLYNAINTIDNDSGEYRGYMILQDIPVLDKTNVF